jgi:hypothetical protein
LKTLAAAVIGGLLLTAVPALAGEADRAAPVTDDFLTIAGPKRLEVRPTLRVPIRCSEGCDTTARTKLKIPRSTIPADVAKGHLAPGEPQYLIVKLNDTATENIEKRPNASRLRVTVRATSSSSGETARADKSFRFKTS